MPTASELARLFGVRDDEPRRWEFVKDDEESIDALALVVSAGTAGNELYAEFLANYLPSLLRAFRELDPQSSLASCICFMLFQASTLPVLTRGIDRLDEARDLPTLLVRRLVSYPFDEFENLPPKAFDDRGEDGPPFHLLKHMHRPCFLYRDFELLGKICYKCLSFGEASKLDFQLESTLLANLVELGTHFLQSSHLQQISTTLDAVQDSKVGQPASSTDKDDSLDLALAGQGKYSLQFVLGSFNPEDPNGHLFKANRRVLNACSRTPGAVEKVSCFTGGADDPATTPLGWCSGCYLVAYCGRDHQKTNRKNHKTMCFKPRWETRPNGSST